MSAMKEIAMRETASATRRDCVVATVDLGDWSAYAAVASPDELLNVLQKYLEVARDSIQRSGGEIEHLIGSTVRAFWPIEELTEPRQRGLGSALCGLIDSIDAIEAGTGVKLLPQLGIVRGPVVRGMIEVRNRPVQLPFGATVPFADRCCSLCADYKVPIVLGPDVPVCWPPGTRLRPLDQVEVKGLANCLQIYTLDRG